MNGRALTEQVKFRLEPELKRAMANIAKRDTVPDSIVYRRAVRAYVNRETKK